MISTLEPLDAASPAVPTMSSLEIAKLCDKEHRNVLRDIQKILNEAGIGLLKFERTYYDSQNKQQRCFELPRRECDLVISGYSVKYRLAIIDRWQELEKSASQFSIPTTMPEALRLAAEAIEARDKLAIELKDAAPAIDFYQAVADSDGNFSIASAAQAAKLGYGQNRLFEKLREMGVLISGGPRHNHPKQEYIERGLFVLNGCTVQHNSGDREMKFTTKVTPKGLIWIREKLGQKEAA